VPLLRLVRWIRGNLGFKYSHVISSTMRWAVPDYLYHGTTTECLESIRESGLLPSAPTRWERRFGARSAVFFTNTVKRARRYARLRRFMSGFLPSENRYELFGSLWYGHYRRRSGAVLRVPSSALHPSPRPDWWWKLVGEWGNWVYLRPVPAADLEVLDDDGTWRPLK